MRHKILIIESPLESYVVVVFFSDVTYHFIIARLPFWGVI
jgi:hypothetical protein